MLQLSGVLEMQGQRLRRDALKLINATLAGTATTNLWNLLESYFGQEEEIDAKELEEAQSLRELLNLQRGDKDDDVPAISKEQADAEDMEAAAKAADEEAQEEDDDASVSSSTSSPVVGVGAKRKTLTELKKKAAEEYPAKCNVKDAKVFYPTSQDTMHTTGVDASHIVHRQRLAAYKGYYECNFTGCSYVAHTHRVCCTHMRKHHLGHALGCRFCPEKKWFQARYWSDHMDKYHSEEPKFKVIELPTENIKMEEVIEWKVS